eukprot:COSAG01_NODE_8006_length_2956_cov_14.158558_4_plen_358_part_00
MVYTEYTVSAKVFGPDYAECNPCQNSQSGRGGYGPPRCPDGKPDGTFVCSTRGGGGGGSTGPPPPPQCQSGFEIYHHSCLNGTVDKTIKATEGGCCAACAAAGSGCAGWNMPNGYNGSVCQLLKEPLVEWRDGQIHSPCKSAQVDARIHENCWFSNPNYATKFAPFCDKSQCQCAAISNAVGVETEPMCHSRRRRMQASSASVALTPTPPPPPPPPSPLPAFWRCTAELQQVCPFDQYRHNQNGCLSCASQHTEQLKAAGCDNTAIAHGCNGNYEGCFQKFDSICASSRNAGKAACEACAYTQTHTAELEAANCTHYFLDYECGGGGAHQSMGPICSNAYAVSIALCVGCLCVDVRC